MLILTRRIGESVYIGDEVRLTVLGVRGTQVRIGINAPKDIPVHREEIYYKIKNEQAGTTPPPDGEQGDAQGDDLAPGNTRTENNSDDMGTHVDGEDESAEEADPNNA